MKNLIIIIGTVILGVIIVNTMILGDGDTSLKGAEQQVWQVRPSDQMRLYPVIDEAFANQRISFGDSPLMRWSVNNAKAEPAPNENYKFGKIAPHSRKTDVFMAFVAAMCVSDKIPEEDALVFGAPVFF